MPVPDRSHRRTPAGRIQGPLAAVAVWTNCGGGANFTTHPHGAKAFGTVATHGHWAATSDSIIVPVGRSSPAIYDANTRQLKYF